ncbi:MAG: pentapeptide repeat-containing protein, partial [Gammaproteobacteria bacterium]|nr:pentapeptide repeat-containing protein [Gammaproteobacteria bacterium]
GGAYLGGADLRSADLGSADLGGADLRSADLGSAYLRSADLRGADLGGAKNYQDSHDIFKEIVRRQKVDTFTSAEWAAIGQITIHTLCWDTIKKRFGDVMGHIFEILAKEGFDEWLKYWNL